MYINEQNSAYVNKRNFLSKLCLIFSIASYVLAGIAGVLGFVGIFELSKDLFLLVEILFSVSFALCLFALIVSIIIAFQCKKTLKNNLPTKMKRRIIISLIMSGYIFVMFFIIFVDIVVK